MKEISFRIAEDKNYNGDKSTFFAFDEIGMYNIEEFLQALSKEHRKGIARDEDGNEYLTISSTKSEESSICLNVKEAIKSSAIIETALGEKNWNTLIKKHD